MINDGNAYAQNGKQYGRVNSEETVCKQVKRLKAMKDLLHVDHQWYISMRNIVKVRWAGVFYDYEKLAQRFPAMDTSKELVV